MPIKKHICSIFEIVLRFIGNVKFSVDEWPIHAQ